MNLVEALNSDDIEVATLAAAILRKEKGKSYVANLIRKYDKYEFRKGEGLVKKWELWGNGGIFNKWKMVNTPLLNMSQLTKHTITTTESTITFKIPCKLEDNDNNTGIKE